MLSRSYVEFKKADEELRTITGVVYEPEVIDTDEDWTDENEIRKAAHRFLADFRGIRLQHSQDLPDVDVVESFIAPADMEKDGVKIKKGGWCVVLKVHSDEIWQKVKTGELTGLSMGGGGTRVRDKRPAA